MKDAWPIVAWLVIVAIYLIVSVGTSVCEYVARLEHIANPIIANIIIPLIIVVLIAISPVGENVIRLELLWIASVSCIVVLSEDIIPVVVLTSLIFNIGIA